MDAIFHEQQEGSLCAQHCLNSLLQGPYFSAVDLACIGRELDEAERATMAEGGINSPEFLHFLQQPSSNVDDSGYFSVQVIERAIKVWGLELIPFGSTEAVQANTNPECEKAFICNFKDHWLTVRKLGQQWFNLNSLLTGPELISDTYLSMLLVQLRNEGYSIFVVRGLLPDNEADQLLNLIPAVQTVKPRLLSDVTQDHSEEVSQEDILRTTELDTRSEVVDVKSSNVRPQRLCYDRIRVPVTTQSESTPSSVAFEKTKNSQPELGASAEPASLYKWIPPTDPSISEQRPTVSCPRAEVPPTDPSTSEQRPTVSRSRAEVPLTDPSISEQRPTVSRSRAEVPLTDPSISEQRPTVSHSRAEVPEPAMETEDYTNDEQITEAAMLQMAIQMSLGELQHEGGS